jgi:hypothetical protein
MRLPLYGVRMRLADQIAQSRMPLLVKGTDNRSVRLTGAVDFAHELQCCPFRYTLNDDLTALCTALAFSKGAKVLSCADLLHVPAERLWIEWSEAPWINEIKRYGFRPNADVPQASGRRGVFIRSSAEGRRGLLTTFWAAGGKQSDALASSMEAYFDFDTPEGDVPTPPSGPQWSTLSVFEHSSGGSDILNRCFRFRYERTWQDYYASALLAPSQKDAIARHALGTIAISMPVLLSFLLMLATRPGLPRRPVILERLNQARSKSGKVPLLDHIEVSAPLLAEYRASGSGEHSERHRRGPRLHHVRGHLVRRGSELFWRVPHLRGSARMGMVRSRTVTWTLDAPGNRGPSHKGPQPTVAQMP